MTIIQEYSVSKLLNVDTALTQILEKMPYLDHESIALTDALGRVLAEDVSSPIQLPPFDNSAMDGYAIRYENSQGASEQQPKTLNVVMDIPAGIASTKTLQDGQAARIMTGAPVPAGASAVIPVEDTSDDWQKGD